MSVKASQGHRDSRLVSMSSPYDSGNNRGGGNPAQDASGRRVYIGNLSWEVKWQDLKDHMRQAGDVVRADILEEPGSGRSKGCAIVEYATAQNAANAIRDLHDTTLMGRVIFVREDRDAFKPFEVSRGGGSRAPPSSARQAGNTRPLPPGPSFRGQPQMLGGPPNKRVYVGNLSYETTWQSLKDHMKQVGNPIRADIMEGNGTSRGCGLVEFVTVREAADAIAMLNNTNLDGRLIFVREDREAPGTMGGGDRAKPPLGSSLGGGRSSGGSRAQQAPQPEPGFVSIGCRLYVGNLSYDVQWQDLKDHFKEIAPVVRADIMAGPDGRSKGCGIIEYQRPEDAVEAYNRLNNTMLKSRQIFVREDREE